MGDDVGIDGYEFRLLERVSAENPSALLSRRFARRDRIQSRRGASAPSSGSPTNPIAKAANTANRTVALGCVDV
jgi:hypothetical protein